MKTFSRPMRNALARAAVRLARRVASEDGWAHICGQLGVPSMRGGLTLLRQQGVVLQRVVDVGACLGHWSLLLRQIHPQVQLLMVEPQPRHRDALQAVAAQLAPGATAAHALLGAARREAVPFTVLDDGHGGTGSSVLAENSDVPRHVEMLPMTTLDQLLHETGFGQPELIKLDVQGYELEVLAGARKALAGTSFVLLEASIWQYNEGSPLVHEVLQWMREAGFVLLDVVDLSRRRDGQLLQADLLFVQEAHPLLRDKVTRFGQLG